MDFIDSNNMVRRAKDSKGWVENRAERHVRSSRYLDGWWQKVEENVQWRDVDHYAETVDGSCTNVYHLRAISHRHLRFLPLQ